MIHHQKYYNHVYSLRPGRHSGEYIEFAKIKGIPSEGYNFMNDGNTMHLHEEPYLLLLNFFTAVKPELDMQYDSEYLMNQDIEKIIGSLTDYTIKLNACNNQLDYEALCKQLYSKESITYEELINYLETDAWEFIVQGMKNVTKDLIDFFQQAIAENNSIYVFGI